VYLEGETSDKWHTGYGGGIWLAFLSRSYTFSASVATSPVESGTEIEWPQVGVGLGLGIMLALGPWLAMRITRIRPLAH
jgi:hypothetical protein